MAEFYIPSTMGISNKTIKSKFGDFAIWRVFHKVVRRQPYIAPLSPSPVIFRLGLNYSYSFKIVWHLTFLTLTGDCDDGGFTEQFWLESKQNWLIVDHSLENGSFNGTKSWKWGVPFNGASPLCKVRLFIVFINNLRQTETLSAKLLSQSGN